MKALILAAGTASRLRPLTSNTPKCLLRVGRRTLLQRSMDALAEAGIREFVVVTGYLHGQIEDFIRQTYGDNISVRFIHNALYESTNNIYSLWLARPEAEGEEVLLLDSDLLYDPQIAWRVLHTEQENILTLIRHPLGEEEMKVVTDAKGASLAAGESLGIERMGKAYTTALYRELEPMMLVEHLENKFYELAFQRLIPQGHTFSVLDVTDLFSCELDTVEDFQNATRLIPPHLL